MNLLWIFFIGSNISHCHHCNSNEDIHCKSDLGNEKFWQICPTVYPYCVYIRYQGIVNRGCSDSDYCRNNTHDECCVCLGEGCNWTAHCNCQRNFATISMIFGFLLMMFFIQRKYSHFLDIWLREFHCKDGSSYKNKNKDIRRIIVCD